MGSLSGLYALHPSPVPMTWTLGETDRIQASKADHELCSELFEKVPEWLEKGILKPSNPKVFSGLDKIGDGFQEYRDGKISAYKIVYKV